MRLLISCLLLAAALPASAQIYSYTDANGNTAFTNEPPEGVDAQPVKLPVMNTMDPVENPTPPSESLPSASEQPYSQLEITDLPSEEALRDNNGTFTVRVKMQPTLMPGHSLQLLLDGKAYGQPSNVPLLQLREIDRGEHNLAVQVLHGDQVVQQSEPVTLNLQRTSTNNPARNKPTQHSP